MRTVRFLTGLMMVVAGVSMAAPMATRLLEAHLAERDGFPSGGSAPAVPGVAAWTGAAAPANPARSPAAGYCIPDPRSSAASEVGRETEATVGRGDPPAPAAAYEPPPPPDLLPALPADLSLAPPSVASTYRSTLDVPPPPLLDVAAPAPLAVSVPGPGRIPATGVIRTVSAEQVPGGPAIGASQSVFTMPEASPPKPAAVAPDSYTIRDGDDLTSIASRLYGHPGAAEAIWSANRDRLADPAVLPIGLALRIPPAWVPPVARGPGAGVPAAIEPARRPARVRVAPGESLETLAERFYGDRAMATRLWEANRDQLRSPSLVVAGMELRLP